MREKENCPKLISKYIRIGRAQGNQKEPRIKAHLQNEIYFLPLVLSAISNKDTVFKDA